MTLTKFQSFWDEQFKGIAQEIIELSPEHLVFNENAKELIFQVYEDFRESVHTYMLDPKGKIDRHKVGALFAFSILKVRPFSLKENGDKPELISYLANELFAFATALSIVRSMILTEARNNNDGLKVKIFTQPFILPDCEHESYMMHTAKSLRYSQLNKSVDFFSLANVLFMIEEYHYQVKTANIFVNLDPAAK